jgi:hypothetical protein
MNYEFRSHSSWTPEMDDVLRKNWGVVPYIEIAAMLGVTVGALKNRGRRIGMEFVSPEKRHHQRKDSDHRPFTPRCAELLRKAGVKI